MKKRMRRLFLQAMEGDSRAFCKLGILFIRGKAGQRDVKLGDFFCEKPLNWEMRRRIFCIIGFFPEKEGN